MKSHGGDCGGRRPLRGGGRRSQFDWCRAGGSTGASSNMVPGRVAGGKAGASSTGAPAQPTQKTSAGQKTLIGTTLPVPPPGGALDHLVIPAIRLSRYVAQGVAETDLQLGPGHYPGTPLPGQAGNVGIAGHRTTFGAPFFRLNEISRGDRILLTDTSGITWVYGVVHQWVVPPTDTGVLDPTHVAMLALTTCNPRFEATSRLIVRAALLERIPAGAKAPLPSASLTSGQSQPSGQSQRGVSSQRPPEPGNSWPATTTHELGPAGNGPRQMHCPRSTNSHRLAIGLCPAGVPRPPAAESQQP